MEEGAHARYDECKSAGCIYAAISGGKKENLNFSLTNYFPVLEKEVNAWGTSVNQRHILVG